MHVSRLTLLPSPVMFETLNVKSEKWLVFIPEKICKKYYT